jgi:flagellin-like protein
MDDDGVSSVIGVILMVMITFILVGMIGIYVLDIDNFTKQEAEAKIDITKEKDTIEAQIVDTPRIESIIIKTNRQAYKGNNNTNISNKKVKVKTGDIFRITELQEGDQVIFIGITSENTRNVIKIYNHESE